MMKIRQINCEILTFITFFILLFLLPVSLMAADSGISFQLIDQHGQPVPETAVHLLIYPNAKTLTHNVNLMHPMEKLTLLTDTDGYFQFPDIAGKARVISIKKDGYRMVDKSIKHANSLLSRSDGDAPAIASGPVTIKMHKSSGPAYLKISRDEFHIPATRPQPVYLDMQSGRNKIQSILKRIKGKSFSNENLQISKIEGLTIQPRVDTEKRIYVLEFSCPDDGSGIIITDEYFFEAPAEGYTGQTSINIPYSIDHATERKLYAYTKASGKKLDQWLYSRIEMDLTIGKAALIADMTGYANPSGSRNLEYNKKYQLQQQAQLRKELDKALQNGADPQEIGNLKQRVEAAQVESQVSGIRRWNFEANRRQAEKQKRQRQMEVEGRIRPKKTETR